MGYFVDGRASAVIGTHTHVPTADEQILPRGTAYITDVGMCGDYDSVLGMEKAGTAAALPDQDPDRAVSAGAWRGHDLRRRRSRSTTRPGLARAIAPIRIGGRLTQAEPQLLAYRQATELAPDGSLCRA